MIGLDHGKFCAGLEDAEIDPVLFQCPGYGILFGSDIEQLRRVDLGKWKNDCKVKLFSQGVPAAFEISTPRVMKSSAGSLVKNVRSPSSPRVFAF